MQQLCTGHQINADGMSLMVEMLAKRDQSICTTYPLVNNGAVYKPSAFMLPSFIGACAVATQPGDFAQYLPHGSVWGDYFRIYIPWGTNDTWGLVVIDVFERHVSYVNPTYAHTGDLATIGPKTGLYDTVSQHKASTCDSLIIFLQLVSAGHWSCSFYPYLVEPVPNVDTGVYVMLALFLLSYDAPPVIFANDMTIYRQKIAHWLIAGSLPV